MSVSGISPSTQPLLQPMGAQGGQVHHGKHHHHGGGGVSSSNGTADQLANLLLNAPGNSIATGASTSTALGSQPQGQGSNSSSILDLLA